MQLPLAGMFVPSRPIIYFWRGGYLPVSIEITEHDGFYGAKRASRWEKLPQRGQKSQGVGTRHAPVWYNYIQS
jgi:hypothetical protein